MEQAKDLSWFLIAGAGLAGTIMSYAAFRFFASGKMDEVDSTGTPLSYRLGFLAVNGIILVLASLAAALLRLFGS